MLKDTLGDAVLLSVFDFIMGFVVLYAIGLIIRSLKYIHIIDRGSPGPKISIRAARLPDRHRGAEAPQDGPAHG